MDRKHVLAILLILIMTTGFVILNTEVDVDEAINGDVDLSSTTQCSVLMEVYGYNDGEQVSTPIVASPFEVGGVEIDELRVNVSWVASGTGVDWSTFSVDGALVVKQLNQYDNWIPKFSYSFSSTEKTGFKYMILTLGTDICLAADIEDAGWFLEVSVPITVTANDEIGVPLSAVVSPRLAGTINIMWSSDLFVNGAWDFSSG